MQDEMQGEYDFSRAKRGAVTPLPPGKTRITIRFDDDILDWFRQQVDAAGGGNYQTLINNALRAHIEWGGVPLEETLRRVVREELQKSPDWWQGKPFVTPGGVTLRDSYM